MFVKKCSLGKEGFKTKDVIWYNISFVPNNLRTIQEEKFSP